TQPTSSAASDVYKRQIVYTRHNFIDPWLFLDVVAPGVMLGQAMGRWGNFTNHEAYGGETTRQFLESLHLPQFIINNMYICLLYTSDAADEVGCVDLG
ncbi:prolipoprotein diacylglyceryl transferase, partial [Enterococcus sp. S181_ASV_20]|nr:prolipoprotein diacylglyceryl transferase [Enterococcus sp. S181_ASV_20]